MTCNYYELKCQNANLTKLSTKMYVELIQCIQLFEEIYSLSISMKYINLYLIRKNIFKKSYFKGVLFVFFTASSNQKEIIENISE